MINIMLVDDEKLFVQSLELRISNESDMNVVATANSAKEAVELCAQVHPDLLLLDIYMKDKRGLDILEDLKRNNKELKILLLTSYSNIDNVANSIIMGADGIVSKDIESEKLMTIIRGINQGLTFFDKNEFMLIKDYFIANCDEKNISNEEYFIGFSNVELVIIKLIAQGNSNKQIADQMKYSLGTVKNYVSKIMKKMNVPDRTSIAISALTHNLI